MNEVRELYQAVIVDHNRHPRNFGKIASLCHHAEGFNPLCGDRLTVYLLLENDIVKNIRFEGSGCAISTASASLMTELLMGKTLAEAEELFHVFHEHITSDRDIDYEKLGKLAVLCGVREFPSRVKCATLAWNTAHAALHESKDEISTE